MANVTKINKVTKFNAIAKALTDAGINDITVDGVTFNVTEFCNREIEIISNKKSVKKSVDNSPFFESMRNALADGSKTPTELVSLIGVANTQKVSAIASSMGDEIVRDVKGKKVTYRLA